MTARRYYTDSYTTSFHACVVEAPPGDRPAAVLDETFFYPTSGGQPHDTGTLGAARVLDVQVRAADGAVLHYLDAPVAPGPVEGRIDWPRRLDHMQQHTGQHILSQAFLRVAQAPTVGFHLGAETVSIDLGAPDLSDAGVAAAESLANEVVAGNAPVRAWFPPEEELRALALRKTPDVDGAVRVVAIGEFDRSACGGTHVAATGEVGLIAVLRTERLTRGTRVEFLCGGRARADYARKHALVRSLSAALTCAPDELPGAVERLRGSLVEARRGLARLREQALDAEAAALLAKAEPEGGVRLVTLVASGRPLEEIRGLVMRLTNGPGVVALAALQGEKTQLVFGRSEGVARDLKPAFTAALEQLGNGRGGGTRILSGAAGPAGREALEQLLRAAAHHPEVPT